MVPDEKSGLNRHLFVFLSQLLDGDGQHYKEVNVAGIYGYRRVVDVVDVCLRIL